MLASVTLTRSQIPSRGPGAWSRRAGTDNLRSALSTWWTICEDIARAWGRDVPDTPLRRYMMVMSSAATVRGFATIGFRISHAAGRRSPLAGAILKQINQVITGCDIAHEAKIGPGLCMWHPGAVVISSEAVIGKRFTIHSSVTLGGSPEGAPQLGDDVNIAPGARVLGPIKTGNRVRIGANAVVTRSFEGNGVVLAGVPAKVLRPLRSDEMPVDESSP